MTKDEFKKLRVEAGHTQATLAREMGVHLRTVTRWEIGEVTVPRVVELALRYIAEHSNAADKIDLRQARAALLEAKKKGTVPWEEIKKDLRLKHRPKKH